MPVCGQLVLSDSFDVAGGNSPGTGFGPDGSNAGVNYQIATRLAGSASSGCSYLQTATTKSSSSYSIKLNKVSVAVAAGAGRFTFSTDRLSPMNLGSALRTVYASPSAPVTYELAVKISNHSTGTERTSFGIATADNGVQAWDLGIQLVNSGSNLLLYRRVDALCNSSGSDYNDVIATMSGQAGAEIDLRLRITDAGAESGSNFNSRYEVFANGLSVFSSAARDFRFANSATRVILFDTADKAGPVTYDAFSLNLVTVTNSPAPTNGPLAIDSHRLTLTGFQLAWQSEPGASYTVLRSTNLQSQAWTLATNVTALGTNTVVTDVFEHSRISYYQVAQLATPGLSISNVTARQRENTASVDIYYDLADQYAGSASISVLVSTDGGQTYRAAAASFSGDVGFGIAPGTARHIAWNVGADWSVLSGANVRIKIVADRAPLAPDMGLIPAGSFNMGDSKAEGLSCEVPVHAVDISAFYIGRHEVTKALWDDVIQWATNHGYGFESPGVGTAPSHPVQQVSWYDAVKWCNARSEKEGFPPAYFEDDKWVNVYRTGELDLLESCVRWHGTGYRLPTEAEWEKAARGGLDGRRFPTGDTLTQAEANYWSTSFESFDVNGIPGSHPMAPEFPNLLPVGSFQPSGYGVYDMAGNIWEWCWDYYGDTWYGDSRASSKDTRGPSAASWGGDRVYRGGSGVDIAWKSRAANRADAPPRFAMGHFGFRVAMPAGGNLATGESAVFSITPVAP